MANIITSCRIICSILLLSFPVFSTWFYSLYIISGLTDMFDGTVARRTNSSSEFGSRLDTIADFIFVAICLIKILPVIDIPEWGWIWLIVIALIKITNVVSGFICQKKFVAEHTIMNKITGLLLFLLPLTFVFINLKYSAGVVCAAATYAAIQEGHFIRSGSKKDLL